MGPVLSNAPLHIKHDNDRTRDTTIDTTIYTSKHLNNHGFKP